jgi:sugar lactone lactonase YvrE
MIWTLLLLALSMNASAQTAHIGFVPIRLFSGAPTGVAVDGSGNIFIANYQEVQEVLAAGGYVTVKTLGSGFTYPYGVALDASGNVFVADLDAGVKEILAAGGYTTVNTLGGGFSQPHSVAVDANGNVFVADTSNNAVKQIPPGCVTSACVKTLGSSFNNPEGVAVDGSGNIFVADTYNNQVKEILATGNYTTTTSLSGAFYNPGGVAVDVAGNVFVADTDNMAAKEILAAGGYTTVNTLSTLFLQPGGIAVDKKGFVYVADTLDNRVVELGTAAVSAAVNLGTIAIGQTSAASSLTFTFDSGGTIGNPVALTLGATGLDFAVASTGTCKAGTFSAGNTCTIDVTFTPTVAGTRTGAVLLQDGSGKTIATGYIHGIGSGPQVSFLPAKQSTLVSGFGGPNGLALDGNGNIFVADVVGNVVREIPFGCASLLCVTTVGSGFTTPVGVAIDGSGNIFVADYYFNGNGVLPGAVREILAAGGYTTVKTLAVGFQPGAMALDASGNLFVIDMYNGGIEELLAAGDYTVVSQLKVGTGAYYTGGIAVDGSGNLFVTFYGVEEILASSGYTTFKTLGSGFNYPLGIGLDGSGNVYIADNGDNAVKEIVAESGYTTMYTLGSGFSSPSGLALDGSGNVYVTDAYNRVVKLDLADAPNLSFATPTAAGLIDTTDGPQAVTVQNIGNATLTFQPLGSSNLLDAALVSSGTDCTALSGLQLASGMVCALGIEFEPAQPGPVSGHVKVLDNALNTSSPNYATQTVTLQGTGLVDPPIVSLSATGLAFGNVTVNTESVYQGVTLTNTGSSPLTISSIALTGTNKTQFLVSSNYCPASLAVGANCIIHLHFLPTLSGAASAALTITDNATGSPHSVSLTGNGTTPAMVSLSATSLAFGNVTVNTESVYQGVTLTNTGGNPLTISSIALTGTNKAQFLVSSNYCPASLTAGANCIIHLHFYPKVSGAASAALTITDNAAGSPQSVALTGTGITPPTVSLSAASLAFGNVTVNTESVYQAVTLTNTSASPLTISSVALTGTNKAQFLISSNYCSATLAAGANCIIHLHFDPKVSGAVSAALTITDNATGAPQSVALSGTGITPPTVFLSATSLAFGNVTVNTESVYQGVTLTNTGGRPLTISSVALTGTNPAQFLISSNTCTASLEAGANCIIHLHFDPKVTGAASAALTITDDATGSPQSVALTGNATTPAAVILSATSLAFGNVAVNTESVYQAVTLTNTGGSPLTISSIALTGTNLAQFLISSNTCTTSLAAGANCIIHLHFYPKVSGSASAALTITDNATGSPHSVALTGTGITPPIVSLSATTLAFGNVAVHTESIYQGLTLTNTGGSPLTISSVALTGTNLAQFLISSNTCPASLAAGASCIIHLHFYPQVAGAASAALTITDSATGSPQSIALTGTGTNLATITSLSPSSAAAGGLAFTLTIYGTNFASGAVATWGTSALTTTYVSATTLTAAVPSSLIAAAGTAEVTVTSNGGTSVGSTFTINAPTVVVTISPSTASVQTTATQQFTATVVGTSNKAVTWSVNNVAGGNSTVGTISSVGLYTAPASLPSPSTVTITATSAADTAKSASATVTLSVATGFTTCAGAGLQPAGANLCVANSSGPLAVNGGLHSVAFGNGLWTAVGSNGTAATSSDGANWTLQTTGVTDTLSEVAFNNGLWVASGNDVPGIIIYSSNNGVNWTKASGVTSTGALTSVAYGNGQWIASGPGDGTNPAVTYTSNDGETWVQVSPTLSFIDVGFAPEAFWPGWTTFANGVWIAGGTSMVYSSDGVHWSEKYYGNPGGTTAAFGKGQWVELGGALGGPPGAISGDGVAWTQVSVPIPSGLYYAISFGNNIWVGSGGNNGIVITSADGTNWATARTDNSGYGQYLHGIAYGNGRWVIVGNGGSAGGGLILVSTSSTIQ